MRIFTFLFLTLFASTQLSAQLFVVNSPSGIAGSYNFGTVVAGQEWGAALADSVWCGDLMIVDPTNGCDPISTVLAGNIAVVDRGVCSFSLKAYHAQEAGASACIIVNNAAGNQIVGMLPGDSATAVTIPVIFVTKEDGDVIKAIMATETVNACMGDIIFPNDVASDKDEVIVPTMGSIPAFQIANAGDAVLTPTARITNTGTNAATMVNTDVTIEFAPVGGSGSQVYTESISSGALEPDSTVVHTAATPFDYSGGAPGTYTINYAFSTDSVDQLPANNNVSLEFSVTENAYSEAPWDFANNRPHRNLSTTIATGVAIEMLSGFQVPVGIGYKVDSISFYASKAAGLEGLSIRAKLYEWEDGLISGTPDNIISNDEAKIVSLTSYVFSADDGTANWITVPVSDIISLNPSYIIPKDGLQYFVGLETITDDTIGVGMYTNYTFGLALDLNQLPSDADLGYFWSIAQSATQEPEVDFEATQLFGDGNGGTFIAALSTAMYINPIAVAVDELTDLEAQINLFPNPASSLINTKIVLDETTKRLEFNITDMSGRQIFYLEKENIKEDNSEFNIEQLPVGMYNMTITTDKGVKTKRFNVQH